MPPFPSPTTLPEALAALVSAMCSWEPLSPDQVQARIDQTLAIPEVLQQLSSIRPSAARGRQPSTFPTALQTLRKMPTPARRLALRAALEVATGSGTLPLAQNLALRTVASALGLTPGVLEQMFSERTGAPLPPIWNPSDPGAWRARAHVRPSEATAWDDGGPYPIPPTPPPPKAPPPSANDRIERIKALALLGLEEGASSDDIKRAFFRVSKVHHPDHYALLGAEATEEATRTFQRIKQAFDFLVGGGTP